MKTLLISPSRCIGCLNCELACSSRDWQEYFPAPSKIKVSFFKDGAQVPLACFQCDCAPCLGVCRTGALSRSESGVIEVLEERCIGCRMCVMACPFGNVIYSPVAGKAIKCDQCGGGEPRCVGACPSRAIELASDESSAGFRRRALAASFKDALKI